MRYLLPLLLCCRALYGEYYIPSSVKTVNGADIHLTAELLLWTARNPELVASVCNLYASGEANAPAGVMSEPTYRLSPGFRVGFGVLLPHDASYLDLQYTRFFFSTKESVTEVAEDVFTLYPVYNADPEGNITAVFYASPSWSLKFNKITAVLGRGSFFGSHTSIDPYFGLTSAFITQNYDVNYESIIGSSSFSYTLKQNGVGPRMGSTLTYYPYYRRFGIGFTADLGSSLLWTKFQPSQVTSAPVIAPLDTNIYYKFHMVMPEVDLSLGLKLDFPSPSKRYNVGVIAAWDTEVWFLGNLFTSFPLPQNNMGQFNMTGLTLSFRFDF